MLAGERAGIIATVGVVRVAVMRSMPITPADVKNGSHLLLASKFVF